MALDSLNRLINYFYIGRQKTAETISGLFGFIYIRTYLSLIVVLDAANWMSAYYLDSRHPEDPAFSLHYNVDFGVNLIGDARQVYTIPLLGLVIAVLNFILVIVFYDNNRFVSHILLAAALLANAMLLIAIGLVYMINFR